MRMCLPAATGSRRWGCVTLMSSVRDRIRGPVWRSFRSGLPRSSRARDFHQRRRRDQPRLLLYRERRAGQPPFSGGRGSGPRARVERGVWRPYHAEPTVYAYSRELVARGGAAVAAVAPTIERSARAMSGTRSPTSRGAGGDWLRARIIPVHAGLERAYQWRIVKPQPSRRQLTMVYTRDVLALIPARSGSKSIPHKNIRVFAGKPLLVHSDPARRRPAQKVTRVIVSTDGEHYADLARRSVPRCRFCVLRKSLATPRRTKSFNTPCFGWLSAREGGRILCISGRRIQTAVSQM